MIDYVNYDLFTTRDSIKNSLTLTFSNGDVITEDSISDESFELTESLCSEKQLTFGCCESSELKITLLGTFLPHDGQMVTVTSVLNDDTENPFTWGTYYVFSDVLTADRTKRELTCYDIMYDILKKDMSEWYNTIAFPTNSTVRTIKWLRDSFMSYLNITQVPTTLVNDNITIAKTISPSQISGKEIIRCICEANGVFGHITRDNKFAYINLKQIILGLYPANDLYPDNDLYPSDEIGVTTIGDDYFYYNCTYESYEVHTIDKLIIRQDDGDVGRIVGTGTNAYIIQGNFLFYGKNNNELLDIANNIYDIISYIKYRPFDCELKGNPCIEVGDGVRIRTTYDVIYSYVLKRTLKGIYALRDTLISDGPELRQEQNNSVNAQLEQLRSKTLKVEQSVDRVSTELTEQLDETVQGSYAYQTAQEIGLKVSKSNIVTDLNDKMSSGITITPNSILITSTGAFIVNTANLGVTSSGAITSHGENNDTTIKDGIITSTRLDVTDGSSSVVITPLGITHGNVSIDDIAAATITLGGSDARLYATGSGSRIMVAGGEDGGFYEGGRRVVKVGDLIASTNINPTLTAAGNVDLYGGTNAATPTWCANTFEPKSSSDRRLKDNVREVTENDFAILEKIKGYFFTFKGKESDGLTHCGVMAQDVLSIMKELGIDIDKQSIVEEYETRSYMDEHEICGEKAYRVNYKELSNLLIFAWQRDHERLNSLEDRLNRLEMKNNE